MRELTKDIVESTAKAAGLKPRLLKELRPKIDDISDWADREMVVIGDRSGNKGILWIELEDGQPHLLPYELTKGLIDKASGRARPAICDFCFTQQPGTYAARISLQVGELGNRSYLCCGDLNCSAHARQKTSASLRSRAQLHEDITPERRIERLRHNLATIIASLAS